MKKRELFSAVIFSTWIFLSCGSARNAGSSKWEPGTELSAFNGGGMVPESETVIIKDSSGVYIHWHLPQRDTAAFILSSAELDSLAIQLNRAKFLSMKSSPTDEIIYDKPSTVITWKKDGQSHVVTDGASDKITTGDEKQFFLLYQYVTGLAKKKSAILQ